VQNHSRLMLENLAPRRECLNHVIIFNENHLKRILKCYREDYHQYRTHLALGKDAPPTRPVEPIGSGKVYGMPHRGLILREIFLARLFLPFPNNVIFVLFISTRPVTFTPRGLALAA
jgi:hypothetical protein